MPTRYYIHIPASVETVDIMGDIVVASTLPYIGTNILWHPLRGYFEKHGYIIEPEIEDKPHYIKYRGDTYEFVWRGHNHVRCIQHTEEGSEEIRFSELPKAIQGLL